MTSDRASRSAPGGRLKSKVLESKFVKAKSDRAKEIESWAKEGRKNVEFMRQSGHLTENVTEDLMLNEKLMELSKSRYKFIVNNKYEKKLFLQKQMKKSTALKESLKDINLDIQKPKWATEVPQTRLAQTAAAMAPVQEEAEETTEKIEVKPLRDKLASAPQRRRPEGYQETQQRPQTTASYSIESRLSSAYSDNNFFPTEPKLVQKKREVKAPHAVHFVEQPNPLLKSRRGSTVKSSAERRKSLAAWAKKSAKSSLGKTDDDRGPIFDIRYTGLTDNLSEVYHGSKTTPDVETIVTMLEALRVPSKRPTERRPKLTCKIKEFLSLRGITINV